MKQHLSSYLLLLHNWPYIWNIIIYNIIYPAHFRKKKRKEKKKKENKIRRAEENYRKAERGREKGEVMAMRELVTGGAACAVPGSSSSSNPIGALANALIGSSSKTQVSFFIFFFKLLSV